jgi:hypothetical protein
MEQPVTRRYRRCHSNHASGVTQPTGRCEKIKRSEKRSFKIDGRLEGIDGTKVLDLALDIDFAEGLGLRSFEDWACFPTNETKFVFLLFEKVLSIVVADELGSVAIGFESEFFGNES